MKPATTISLAALAAGIFTFIWFVERHTESTTERAESSAKVLSIDSNKISAFTVQNGDSRLEILKKDGAWRIEHPLSDRADSGLINQLIASLELLKHSSKIELPPNEKTEKLKEFGLSDPNLRLRLKADTGKETELLFGKESAVSGKMYARVLGSDTVQVIDAELRDQITKKTDAFRDKRLSDTPARLAQKITIQSAEGELELERKSGHWEILKPLHARASDSKVNDLLADVLNAKVLQFLPETPTPEQGLGEPTSTLTLSLEGQKEPVTLKIGATPPGEENRERSFAKLSSRPAVTVLQNSSFTPLLRARPNELRDRQLVRVESDIVDRITLEPDGKPRLVLVRKGEGWALKDGDQLLKINEKIPAKILSNLQTTEVTNFVADIAANLEQYGLDRPKMKVTFSSYASENTAETKAGEKPIASLLFGKVEGDSGFAKLDNEPFIVAAPRALLESLPRNNVELQPAGVCDFNPEDAISLEVIAGDSSVKIDRKDSSWKAAEGDALINQANVSALLSTLSCLKTSFWITREDAGLLESEKPALTLRTRIKAGTETTVFEIHVWRPLGQEGFYATHSEKDGVFLMSPQAHAKLASSILEP